ncbi:MAG TPA: hypothetical protein PKY81_15395 [bacterium]|mgnify:CR=1 FL=1|nr:hypothetical protein [bacterium]
MTIEELLEKGHIEIKKFICDNEEKISSAKNNIIVRDMIHSFLHNFFKTESAAFEMLSVCMIKSKFSPSIFMDYDRSLYQIWAIFLNHFNIILIKYGTADKYSIIKCDLFFLRFTLIRNASQFITLPIFKIYKQKYIFDSIIEKLDDRIKNYFSKLSQNVVCNLELKKNNTRINAIIRAENSSDGKWSTVWYLIDFDNQNPSIYNTITKKNYLQYNAFNFSTDRSFATVFNELCKNPKLKEIFFETFSEIKQQKQIFKEAIYYEHIKKNLLKPDITLREILLYPALGTDIAPEVKVII